MSQVWLKELDLPSAKEGYQAGRYFISMIWAYALWQEMTGLYI